MQKLEFTNGNGVSIDLTDHVNFGVTKWSGLSEVGVEVQTQQVPFADGNVYLDNLLSQREINVTVAIQDNGDLERRYELQRRLIECLNPKLGEGVLTYTNDYLSKQIKALPQVPVFPNKNSNESGTLKGSVTFTCCNPYWEDKKESIIPVGKGVTTITNSGDVPSSVKLDIFTSSAENLKITNLKNNKVLQFSETLTKDVNINTELGGKRVTSQQLKWKAKNINSLCSVIYCDDLGLLVAVGINGTILTSSDSLEWEQRNVGISITLNSICYSSDLNLFITVGANGVILTSSDGETWTSQTSGISNNLYSICYSSDLNLFITVGANGVILTSSDGETWTSQTSGITRNLNSICYSSELNLFVVVGDNGVILASSDGINWTSQSIGIINDLNSICYNSDLNLFVVVGFNGTILTSSNGINWTSQTSSITNVLRSTCYSSDLGLFIAVGNSGTILTSSDGINWTSQSSVSAYDLWGCCFSSDLTKFVIVGTVGIIINSYFSEAENLISELTPNSDMTFSLEVGENQIIISAKGRLNGRISYRNKYIGV
jgi:hypothetical protein